MATPTITNSSTNNSLLAIPAHIWIGPSRAVRTHVLSILQKQFCNQNGCTQCHICQAIAQEQHHAIRWIRPEKQYTRELLEPLFAQISFALDTHEQFFFILEQADFMPAACANSLLKSLEEPPHGFYFFLCAEQEQAILPTICSRCVIHNIAILKDIPYTHGLFDFFTNTMFGDPTIFIKELDVSEINERESMELLNALLTHWMHRAKKALQENDSQQHQTAQQIIARFSKAFEQPPMPGSSKIFWKNMYLNIKDIAS